MNIYESISKAMSEIEPIAKAQKNVTQGFMFRGIDSIMNELQPVFIKNKIFITTDVLETIREERQTSKGGTLLYSILKIKFTFYAADGSCVSSTVIGEGMDSGDKASNKALSVGFKYACLQIFCIPTEDTKDPDFESHEVIKIKTVNPDLEKLTRDLTDWMAFDPPVFNAMQIQWAEKQIAEKNIEGMRTAIAKAVDLSKAIIGARA